MLHEGSTIKIPSFGHEGPIIGCQDRKIRLWILFEEATKHVRSISGDGNMFVSGPIRKVAFWKGNWDPLFQDIFWNWDVWIFFGCLDLTDFWNNYKFQIRRSLWQTSANLAARTEVLEHELKRERDEKAELEKWLSKRTIAFSQILQVFPQVILTMCFDSLQWKVAGKNPVTTTLHLLAIEKQRLGRWSMGPRQLVRTKVRFAESLQSQGKAPEGGWRSRRILPVGSWGWCCLDACGVYGQMI